MFGLDLSVALLLIFCITAALAFEFINGFHDTANAVATVIYTHSLKPNIAVIWSGIWNFIGVNVGGIAVAMGIINLLPIEALTDGNVYHNVALVMALIITAIIWNIGTWYLGIPCSSSHALIGSITGVSIGYILLPNNHDIILNWDKVKDAGLSLLISPVIGFILAGLLMMFLGIFIRNKTLFKEPPTKKAPPFLTRATLILTSTFVSFSHGSNDGQKGVGLLMIILIAIVPARFALDHHKDPQVLNTHIASLQKMTLQIDPDKLDQNEIVLYKNINANLDTISHIVIKASAFGAMSDLENLEIRRNILYLSKQSDRLITGLSDPNPSLNARWRKTYRNHLESVKSYTEYAPWWVIFLISVSLGLGTMIGWKRIVVTLGEKIGKSKLTYAQGAAANLVAAGTISISSYMGHPVSTTHVLSSGIAGTMVSGKKGMKNLQTKTLASIGIAWLITIPVTMLFSGVLFLLFRLIL